MVLTERYHQNSRAVLPATGMNGLKAKTLMYPIICFSHEGMKIDEPIDIDVPFLDPLPRAVTLMFPFLILYQGRHDIDVPFLHPLLRPLALILLILTPWIRGHRVILNHTWIVDPACLPDEPIAYSMM